MICQCCDTKMAGLEKPRCMESQWWVCPKCAHAQLGISTKTNRAWHSDFDSKRNWKPVYSSLRSRRYVYLKEKGGDADSVLDIGCARGTFLRRLSWIPRRVGIEVDQEAAKHWVAQAGLEHVNVGLLEYKPAKRFGLVMAWHSLEHMQDVGGAISKMIWACSPGGFVALELPVGATLTERRYRGHIHRFSQQSLLCLLGRRIRGANLISAAPGFQPASVRVLLQKHGGS